MKQRIDHIYWKCKREQCKNCEHYFEESPQYSYLYALNIMNSRLKNEKVFIKDMSFAVLYAKDVINGRLPLEVEEKTFFNLEVKCFYYGEFIEEGTVILDNLFYLYNYSLVVGRLDEYLHNYLLMESLRSDSIYIKNYFKSLI